jgi:hypothetical protein
LSTDLALQLPQLQPPGRQHLVQSFFDRFGTTFPKQMRLPKGKKTTFSFFIIFKWLMVLFLFTGT